MGERYSLVEVTIDGEARPTVTGVVIRERGRSRIYGWLDRFRGDAPPGEHDLRALTMSGELLDCRVATTAVSAQPARTEFEVRGDLEVARLR